MTAVSPIIADNFIVRSMTRSELDLAIFWAAEEGWNPGIYDAECFYQCDRHGFFLGELNGEPIGSISAVTYGKDFGFVGFYVVKPQFRGYGFGIQMWKAAMAYLGNERNIGLDGVIAQQQNYKKSGFQFAHNHVRYEGVGGGAVPDNIVELTTVPFDSLVAYDLNCFGYERSHFLQLWIQQPNTAALGVVTEEHILGYGVIRQSHTGFRIGPLFANDGQIAEQLLLGLVAKATDAPVFLDVPDANPEAIALAQRYGMKPVFEAARMYTKQTPSIPINRVFGVTSLELG
ncbi:MAG: GNAT family N-acetyltransferase [Scytonema sp. PMC 1069.18]|nr:GNAT family N-acetyltransferase [Scytonema sp. PMC 1069.18]MEC4884457.1 GNAT family N-acetyltransferase [Scytonema sp. PMC 1070.18]